MNTSPIKLRRSTEYYSFYHIRSGLRVLDLPAGWRVESDVFRSHAYVTPQWVDDHRVLNQDGELVCYGESLSDDMRCDFLSDLRAALASYCWRWNGHALVVE